MILAQDDRLGEARQAINEALRVRPGLTAEDVRALVGRRGVQILTGAELLR